MPIAVGDKIPSITLKRLGADGMEEVKTDDVFAGKTVVLFAVPGAFTPTCSAQHVPSFLGAIDALKAKGVDTVACTSVNDPFVMKEWAEKTGAAGSIEMLPDGNAELATALGLTLDASGFGLGTRSLRYGMVVKNGTVAHLGVEENPGQMTVSGAEEILKAL